MVDNKPKDLSMCMDSMHGLNEYLSSKTWFWLYEIKKTQLYLS